MVLLCKRYSPQSLEGAPLWAQVVLEEQLLGWTLQEMEGLESYVGDSKEAFFTP